MLFSLAACGSKEKTGSDAKTDTKTQTAVSAATEQQSSSGQDTQQTDSEPSSAPAIDYAVGHSVPCDSGAKWYVQNNFKEEYFDASSEGVTASYIQFSGLKNKEVEASINKQIKDEFDKLLDADYVPPFDNAEYALSLLNTPVERFISSSVDANVNNVLCIDMYLSLNKYSEDGERNICVSETVPLCFDLNSGKRIKFTDMLTDDVNGIEFVNQRLKDMIADNEEGYLYTDIAFKEDFPGFREDQKFLIDSHSNSLGLVLDYNDTSVDFNANNGDDYVFIQTQGVYINLNGVSALADRFYSKDQPSLFEDETTVKYSIRSNEYNSIGSRYHSEPFGDDRITMYLGYVEYPEMIDAVKTYIEEARTDTQEVYDKVKAKVDALGSEEYDVFGGVEIDHYRCGDYTCIEKNINYTIYDGDWNEIDSESKYAEPLCFKGSSTQPMKITEFFKPGTDCKAVIKEAFKQNAGIKMEEYGFDIDETTLELYFTEMINNIIGFRIDEYGLLFSYANQEKITAKRFPEFSEEDVWFPEYLCSYAEFEHLGFDNLTVFE